MVCRVADSDTRSIPCRLQANAMAGTAMLLVLTCQGTRSWRFFELAAAWTEVVGN
eukprot:m.393213 g.393213  ORF g.393213 m.393213 type:complete len:55 (-) comp20091_c0_seq1:1573-1737(-)